MSAERLEELEQALKNAALDFANLQVARPNNTLLTKRAVADWFNNRAAIFGKACESALVGGRQEPAFVLAVTASEDGSVIEINHPMGSDAWLKARIAMQVAHLELTRQLRDQENCPARPRSAR